MGSINWHEFEFSSQVIFVSTVGARAMTTRLVQGKFSLSQNCALIIPRRDDVVVEFFEGVFQRLFSYERASISLIMQPSLRFADLNRFYVPHPPHAEQLEIVRVLSREGAALNTAISRLEREIELLREYRIRLIADVVTGKLDVREAAARLPEEATSLGTLDGAETPTENTEDGEDADAGVAGEDIGL
jgi:type I restriction enzyme S subunit